MQTFLPYPNYALSAQALDHRRLGKQRVEAMQILATLELGKTTGWARHPAVRMWEGHARSLALYHDCCIHEWIRRGYHNTMRPRFDPTWAEGLEHPWWLGVPELHASHRSALLHKDPEHYSIHQWTDPPVLEYWWPTEERRCAHLHSKPI